MEANEFLLTDHDVGRPPATCLRRHVHQFALDGRSYEIMGLRGRRLRIWLAPRFHSEDVRHCAMCGGLLRTVEG